MVGTPNVAEVVDLVVRLEDDPARRGVLDSFPHDLFRAAVDDGLVALDRIETFANIVGEAVQQGLLGYRRQQGGVILPPDDAPWTDHAFQSRSGYYSTVDGQQMATLRRQRIAPSADRAALARRLTGEMEESEDLLGEALETGHFWLPPRKCPDLVWPEYDKPLAAASPETHKAVQDAYRKLNDLNWKVPQRAAEEVPGAILGEGQGLTLDDRDRERLRGVVGVIRNAKEHLAGFGGEVQPQAESARSGPDPREHWRSQIDYVFALPAPSSFPALKDAVAGDDDRVLRRYIDQAHDLSQSEALNAKDVGYTVSFTQTEASVESNLPSSELVRGLAVTFRQLYSPEEKASFAAAMRVLQQAVRGQEAGTMQAQVDRLAEWGRAAGKLRSDWLEALAFERGTGGGGPHTILRAPVPDQTPEQVLSAFFYGEYIHWDTGSQQVEEWAKEPLDDARYRFYFLTAMAQLAAVYIPFGDLVANAIGAGALSAQP
jgi:hypothetical protein